MGELVWSVCDLSLYIVVPCVDGRTVELISSVALFSLGAQYFVNVLPSLACSIGVYVMASCRAFTCCLESGVRLSSQIYRILGRTVVTYPKLLDETDFYMALDMFLLIDEIKVKILTSNPVVVKNRSKACLGY